MAPAAVGGGSLLRRLAIGLCVRTHGQPHTFYDPMSSRWRSGHGALTIRRPRPSSTSSSRADATLPPPSGFCDPRIDELMDEATAMQAVDPAGSRIRTPSASSPNVWATTSSAPLGIPFGMSSASGSPDATVGYGRVDELILGGRMTRRRVIYSGRNLAPLLHHETKALPGTHRYSALLYFGWLRALTCTFGRPYKAKVGGSSPSAPTKGRIDPEAARRSRCRSGRSSGPRIRVESGRARRVPDPRRSRIQRRRTAPRRGRGWWRRPSRDPEAGSPRTQPPPTEVPFGLEASPARTVRRPRGRRSPRSDPRQPATGAPRLGMPWRPHR